MTFLQDIPVHSPLVRMPRSGLRGCLRWSEYPNNASIYHGGRRCLTNTTYLTCRACRSTGAPESTAAATTSPGSLPSITRLGTGEKVLLLVSLQNQAPVPVKLRGALINPG
jgi:hypothetical protein